MGRPGLILLNLAVAVGAVALYVVLFPLETKDAGGETASDDQMLDADAGQPDPALADRIGLLLMKARSAVMAAGSDEDLRALFTKAGIELDPAAESALFPVYREHFEALRENLQTAHGAALGNATLARRGAIRARSVLRYSRLTADLRAHLTEEQLMAFLRVCPQLVPPPPAR